jgi:hypothetical protein
MNKKYQHFKSLLYKNNVNKAALFHLLKVDYSSEEQDYIIKRIPKQFDTLIYGKPFVTKIEDFAKNKLIPLEELNIEINWLIHLFKKYSNELSMFIKHKEEFEQSFLLGNYEKSGKILSIIKKTTLSYWGLENRFLQKQYEQGLEHNFKLLNFCKNQKVNDPAYFLIISFLSNKAEEDISYISYDNSFDNLLGWGINKYYTEYFKYRLNPINYNFEDFESVLWANGNLSLLDKYLGFRDILFSLILSDSSSKKKIFTDKSLELLQHIEDPLVSKTHSTIGEYDLDSDMGIIMSIIDQFTQGLYEDVINNSESYLQNKVTFILLELYVKSHIHLNRPINFINSIKNHLNILLEHLYNYLCRNEKSADAFVDLLTIANSISSFDISKEIVCFINLNMNSPATEFQAFHLQKSFLYSRTLNPIHYSVFENIETQKDYLSSFKQYNCITTQFFIDIITNRENVKTIYSNTIPSYRIGFYIAKQYYEEQMHNECIAELLEILPALEKINYLREKSIAILFDCYFNLNLNDLAINLYVNTFLENSQLVPTIDAKLLSERIIKQKWKNISHDNINFPIFIFLAHDEIHPKYIAYDLYMRTQNITHPSKLFNDQNKATNQHIYFLKNIANPKIISRKVMVFKNSNSVLNERIAIFQFLAKIDPEKVSEYNKEISEITKRLTVQLRIKEVDQSKIYVDENGIIESEVYEIKKSFNRFTAISDLLKQNKIDSTGIAYEALFELLKGNIDTETYKKSIRKTDLHFELFIRLFLEIRDKFLFSNQYGLDYYLSQRIRHGTIISQIRKSFKSFNLVTTKTSNDGVYLPNSYWLNGKLELNNKQKIEFEERMSQFSASIDKIINDLKDQFIQIRTEDIKTKQTGWFDFRYNPILDGDLMYQLLVTKVKDISDFKSFLKLIFELLWVITDERLESIREKINLKIKDSLIYELDSLEVDIKTIIPPTRFSNPLYKSIADCRTAVQADINYVISWFNKSKNDEIDFLIEDAFYTSITIVNNIITPTILDVSQSIKAQSLIKGMYFPHFVDLFKIFMTNIYDYYKNNDMLNYKASVCLNENQNILSIEFKNNIASNENMDLLVLKLDKIKQDLTETNFTGIRGEGNTGFSKANNILKNVFKNKSNELTFNVNETSFLVTCNISLNNLTV